jgi:hypothetical protein
MNTTKIFTGVAALVAAAGLVGTGAVLSNAATTSPTATSTSAPDGRGRSHGHTPVTGAELTRVTAAVKANDSAVTVTSVQKDPDGSYDVFGTKAGATVRLEASADLKTVTVSTGRGGRGGGHSHTPVIGGELTRVTAAVNAKDSAVTVTSVQKDPDGSYDVFGTKAGANVKLDVSQDLKTITTSTGGQRG